MDSNLDLEPLAVAPAPVPAALAGRFSRVAPGSPAEDALVREHLPLVKTVVGRLAMSLPSHVDIADLHSSGLVGLLNAVRNYDPQGGSSFGSYARVRIRGAILDELRRLDWVPRSVHSKARKVQFVIQRLEQEHGEIPDNATVAKAMSMTIGEYEELLEEIRPATFVSLDGAQSIGGGEEDNRYEGIADESQSDPMSLAVRRELSQVIAQRLEQLPEMQRKVLALYYFEDMRLREIAEVFGVTESRICQIHSQAILTIKAWLRKHEAKGE